MILIISTESDFHAHAVSKGLDELGSHSQLLCLDGSPFNHEISLSLQEEECLRFRSRARSAALDFSKVRTIWHRRSGSISAPDRLPSKNHKIFNQEWQDSRRGMLHLLDQAAPFWANHWMQAWRAENKVLQLSMAKKLGFKIPRTLISNSADEIRRFYESHDGNIIHKMFNPATFEGATACTAKVAPELMSQTQTLGLCPGIFQEFLDIEFEARVLVAGEEILAAKMINSGKAGIDIRRDQLGGLAITPMELPAAIHERCIQLTRQLGLCTCSIDLAYTRSGQWNFFEVNQAGQFLWMELHEPELRTLDLMCRFLVSGTADFRLREKPSLKLADHLPKEFFDRPGQEWK